MFLYRVMQRLSFRRRKSFTFRKWSDRMSSYLELFYYFYDNFLVSYFLTETFVFVFFILFLYFWCSSINLPKNFTSCFQNFSGLLSLLLCLKFHSRNIYLVLFSFLNFFFFFFWFSFPVSFYRVSYFLPFFIQHTLFSSLIFLFIFIHLVYFFPPTVSIFSFILLSFTLNRQLFTVFLVLYFCQFFLS